MLITNLWKLAFILQGWKAWNMAAYTSKPADDVEFPRSLIRSGEGVLIAHLTGRVADEKEYQYNHLYNQCKDHYRSVCPF
jgi:hypothetical protein